MVLLVLTYSRSTTNIKKLFSAIEHNKKKKEMKHA